MKVTWVLLLAIGVVSADVSLGYNYKIPQTSFGYPSYQLGSGSSQYSSAYAGNHGGYDRTGQIGTGYQTVQHGTGYQTVQHGTGYQTGNHGSGYHTAQHGTGYQTAQTSGLGTGNYQTAGASTTGYLGQQTTGTGFQTQYQASSQFQAAAEKRYKQYYEIQQQPAQVFKHFYVHAAPEEPEEVKVRTPIVLPPPQKHYKIIFVKAPSEASQPNIIAPIQPQTEEKTIVYVLVKKPEDQKDLVLPKIEQKPPSKPEVYFIKYKNKEDSQAVINNIVKDYNKGQPLSLNSASGESSYQSGFGTVQYQTPVQQSSGDYYNSLGSQQSFGLSSATSGTSGLGETIVGSTIAPAILSSTASSVTYEGGAISTSQGVPHETYGPPKFREI